MTRRDEGDLDIGRRDAELLERLRTHHRLEPMPSARKAAFLREVGDRLETPPRRRITIPALVVPAVALAAGWLYFTGALAPPVVDLPATTTAEAAADVRWAYEVLYPSELSDIDHTGDSEMLPEDYLAIGSELWDI